MSLSELRQHIEHNGIVRCPPGFFLQGIPTGKVYTWQFYLRRMIFNQKSLKTMTSLIYDKLSKDLSTHQIAGMETAGPPIISALMQYAQVDIHAFSIRKDQKKYGLFNWIEGTFDVSKPVILIDDISNSKTTLERAKEICESHGMKVDYALTLVDKKSTNKLGDLDVVSLFMADDFALSWDDYYKKYPNKNKISIAKDFIITNQHILLAPISKTEAIPVDRIFIAAAKGVKFPKEIVDTFSKYNIKV